MSVIFSGSLADNPPFILFAGEKVPDQVRAVMGVDAVPEAGSGQGANTSKATSRTTTRSGGTSAAKELADMHAFPTSSRLFEKLLESRREQVSTRLRERVYDILREHVDRLRKQLAVRTDPRARLELGMDWYNEYGSGIVLFGERPAVQQFLPWFGTRRDEDYGAVKEGYLHEIVALESLAEVHEFLQKRSLPLDSRYSENWRQIDARLLDRKAEIERENLVARVGDGPFGPDYPGAIYLNAVYRMDHERIRDETEILMYSLSHAATSVGWLLSRQDIKAQYLGSARGTSIVDPLLAYFAGSYQRHYPQCMDQNPRVFRKTFYFANITRTAFGDTYVTSGTSQTLTHRINLRHAPAFEYLEAVPATPDGNDMFMAVMGGSLPDYVKKNLDRLTDALRGLRQVMQERTCSDPVIERLDRNLVALFNKSHRP